VSDAGVAGPSATRVRAVLATHNKHKLEEFAAIIAEHLQQVELVEYDGPEPVEDGVTFAENALIKARAAAAHTGLLALADDSGICVDVLAVHPACSRPGGAGDTETTPATSSSSSPSSPTFLIATAEPITPAPSR
jgi:XTP/dITP diphosphohydrolase